MAARSSAVNPFDVLLVAAALRAEVWIAVFVGMVTPEVVGVSSEWCVSSIRDRAG
jgi:hypothetical protein